MTGRVVVALALLVAVVLPFVGASYAVPFTIRLFLFVILAYSWNIISGYTGHTSFGHTSFFGIGAYASALLVLHVRSTGPSPPSSAAPSPWWWRCRSGS